MKFAVAMVLAGLSAGAYAQEATPAAPAAKTATTQQAKPWTKIPVPPLHEFKPEEPKKIVLSNGLMIFLAADHELPFINGSILIRGGSRDEPADKVGLVSLYGQTWRTSGTKSQRRRKHFPALVQLQAGF